MTTGTPQPSASPTRSAVAWDRTTWWLWTGRYAIDSPMTGVNHKGKFTSLHYYKDIVYNKHIWYIIVTPYSDPMPFIPFISSLVGASNHIRLPITSEPPKYYPKGRWDWIPCDWSQKSVTLIERYKTRIQLIPIVSESAFVFHPKSQNISKHITNQPLARRPVRSSTPSLDITRHYRFTAFFLSRDAASNGHALR